MATTCLYLTICLRRITAGGTDGREGDEEEEEIEERGGCRFTSATSLPSTSLLSHINSPRLGDETDVDLKERPRRRTNLFNSARGFAPALADHPCTNLDLSFSLTLYSGVLSGLLIQKDFQMRFGDTFDLTGKQVLSPDRQVRRSVASLPFVLSLMSPFFRQALITSLLSAGTFVGSLAQALTSDRFGRVSGFSLSRQRLRALFR